MQQIVLDVSQPKSEQSSAGSGQKLWQSGAWKVFALFFLYTAGPTLTSPLQSPLCWRPGTVEKTAASSRRLRSYCTGQATSGDELLRLSGH